MEPKLIINRIKKLCLEIIYDMEHKNVTTVKNVTLKFITKRRIRNYIFINIIKIVSKSHDHDIKTRV